MSITIRNAVFAGGGARCFWQLGFWQGAREAGAGLENTVTRVSAVSAGCAMATAALLQRERDAIDLFEVLTRENPANIHWRNFFSNEPVLPHSAMNRYAMETLITAADLVKLKSVTLEYLMARYPSYLSGPLAALFAFSVYGLEKRIKGRVHPRWTRSLGFSPLVATNHQAENVAELIEMIVGSSSVPPVLPCDGYRGEPVLDGGVVDNVPAFLTAEHTSDRDSATLVLLSKRYRLTLPQVAGRIYLQPSREITLDKFNYADPKALRDTFELGVHDGRHFAAGLGA